MTMNPQSLIRIALTTVVVAAAALIGYALWKHYMYSPWTRDGRVRAEIVHVAPDVSGLVAEVQVHDNQLVKAGQVLFRIDPRRFQLALARAEADLGAAQAAARAAGASIFAASAGTAASQADYEKYRAQAERRERAASVISAEAAPDAVATARAARPRSSVPAPTAMPPPLRRPRPWRQSNRPRPHWSWPSSTWSAPPCAPAHRAISPT